MEKRKGITYSSVSNRVIFLKITQNKCLLFTEDHCSRERINNIWEEEGITDFTYYYENGKFEVSKVVNGSINLIEKIVKAGAI